MAAMPRLQFQVKIFFLALFAVICAGLWTYQLMYVKPARECEESGKWWYKPARQCTQPVKISDLTGAHMDEPMPGDPVLAPGQAPGLAAQAPGRSLGPSAATK
jgi:hypothetical protein